MRANRRRDTRPERALRRELFRRGLRFRVDYRIDDDSGAHVRPDIVFTRRRLAIFVDGCYWHGCPEHATMPKSNAEFWARKFERNHTRDLRDVDVLEAAGWTVMRVWEHVDSHEAADIIERWIADQIDSRPSDPSPSATRSTSSRA